MKNKKIWILLALVICMFGTLVLSTNAASSITISSNDISAQYSSTIEVPINISNNSGIMGFGFEVEYDENYLEPVSAESSSLISSGTFDNSIGTKYANPFRVVWADTQVMTSTGELFSLKFTAKKSGTTTIKVSCMEKDTYDGDYNKLTAEEITINVNILCNHSYTEKVEKEATCTAEGINSYTCSICGDKYEETADKIAHSYDLTTTNATCTKAGSKDYKCSVCGYSYSEIIAAKGHSYKGVVTAPTCTTKGHTTYICSSCSDSYISDYKDITSHIYTSKVTKEATCTAEGVRTHTCSGCGTHYEEKIAKASHKYSTATTAATCTKDGEKKYTCSECGYSYSEVIAASGHDYEGVVSAATCTTKGYTTYTCYACNDSYISDYKDITSHSYTSKITKEVTCTAEGVRTYTCLGCGTHYEEKIAKASHKYSTATTVATCTRDGEKKYTCESCKYSYTETIASEGHHYKSAVTAPTCASKGYTTHECTNCDDTYVDSYTDLIAHTEVIDEKVESTCVKTGLTEGSHCSSCGKVMVEQQIIKKIAHDYVKETVVPTCDKRGYDLYKCSMCEDSYIDNYVSASGHTMVVDYYKAPSCTETGLTEGSHCLVCNDVIVAQQELAKLSHIYEQEVVKATCTEDGYTNNTCKHCEDSYTTDVVPALDHDYVSFITKPAGIGQSGVETYQCKECGDSYTKEIPALDEPTTDKPTTNEPTTEKPSDEVTTNNEPTTTKYTNKVKTKIKKIKKLKKRKIKVTWKKVKDINGYQIQYALNKKFTKNVKYKNVKVNKKSVIIKKLKKKTYYIRIRTYKIYNGEKVYSKWSKKKNFKIK